MDLLNLVRLLITTFLSGQLQSMYADVIYFDFSDVFDKVPQDYLGVK